MTDHRTPNLLARYQSIEDERAVIRWQRRVAENIKSRTVADPRYLAELKHAQGPLAS